LKYEENQTHDEREGLEYQLSALFDFFALRVLKSLTRDYEESNKKDIEQPRHDGVYHYEIVYCHVLKRVHLEVYEREVLVDPELALHRSGVLCRGVEGRENEAG
jgi:hypothetical protein